MKQIIGENLWLWQQNHFVILRGIFMVNVFKYVDKFFTSLTNYLTYNYIFIIFIGLFLFTALCVIFFTSRSYEARLIKAIDKFNVYFIDNPHINEENLVAFNAKMKSRKVPKQLRKSWQQFVLYREGKASSYMSFENCVANPIKNSTYTRDLKTMNSFAWIFSISSMILNAYYCYEVGDLASILQSILLTPVLILLLNYIVQIFLNLRHSAIVSDLFQNYQYFEVNIDKATETLPDYVDYEVLFDKNEIKKGIPILYAYLQKRAEEEQRELERARLRNVEHEKFNFDDQGVAASLVLERAMQEAENYIAERKKYNQNIGQINSDITQEDMNYREITKEYNRQMQVSKETFENFKSQLQDVSSSIEANYLKKQQQQELDRQRNLERDFDTATERHKKVIDDYHAELDTVDKFIATSRKNLEDAMKSEFSSYSSKVYDEAKKLVEEREKEKIAQLKQEIENLEEAIVAKNQELDNVYQQNQIMSDKLEEIGIAVNEQPGYSSSFKPTETEQPKQEQPTFEPLKAEPVVNEEPEDEEPPVAEIKPEFVEPVEETQAEIEETPEETEEVQEELAEQETVQPENIEKTEYLSIEEMIEQLKEEQANEEATEELKEEDQFFDFDEELPYEQLNAEDLKQISTESIDDSIETKPVSKRGRPRKVVDMAQTQGEKKKRGRPRKEKVDVQEQPKRKVGRPKKSESVVETQGLSTEPKHGRGRPKKQVAQVEEKVKLGVGRPKKVSTEEVKTAPVKKGRGRPRKVVVEQPEVSQVKRGRGRPRKTEQEQVSSIANEKVENLSDIKEIDEYLKEIDNQIAAENAKLEETQRELAKKAKLRAKK